MATREPRGLGKGLSALLGEVPNADQLRKPVGYINKELAGAKPVQNVSDVLRIPVSDIEANPYQPRDTFNQEAIDELTESIKVLGLIQPITVRKVADGKYQIISGERRFRACCQAGMTSIPSYIREANDRGMMEMAIVENIQRENLDPIEIAMSYKRLMDECSMTQEEMAQRLGKKRASVANFLRLLNLPIRAQHDLKAGQISVGHAKVILGVEDPNAQEQLCDLVISKDLSVRQLEEKVKELQKGVSAKAVKTAAKELPAKYQNIENELSKFFKEKPQIKRNTKGGGSISVKFSSDTELDSFLDALSKVGK